MKPFGLEERELAALLERFARENPAFKPNLNRALRLARMTQRDRDDYLASTISDLPDKQQVPIDERTDSHGALTKGTWRGVPSNPRRGNGGRGKVDEASYLRRGKVAIADIEASRIELERLIEHAYAKLGSFARKKIRRYLGLRR